MYISLLYLTLFFLSLFATFLLVYNISNKRASYYVVLFTLVTVVCLAYFAYSTALDTGMALTANQFSYIDGTFMQMFFLFCVLDICGIEIKKAYGIPLTVCNLFFLLLAFTTQRTGLLYKTYEIGFYKDSAHLDVEFGPLQVVFLFWVVFNTVVPMGMIIYSIVRKKKISYKYTLALGGLEVAIVSLYFIERAFNLGFDILPCGYVLMEFVILGIIHRIALYDGSQIVLYNSEDRREFGYIIFDIKKNYVGSNMVARFYFPEINNLAIDRPVSGGFIKDEFVDRLSMSVKELESSRVYSREGKEVVCTIKPYRHGPKSTVYGYIIEIRDDTEQQRLIQELNKVNDELEKAVQSAVDASKAKSEFLASMSHEIRTPMNAVLGMNEIALRECKDEAIISYLKDIQNAGSTLLTIINDILDFSKIEAGKIELIKDEYETLYLINGVKNIVEAKAKEKNLDFVVDVDSNIPSMLYGDEGRIRQIIINILNNAVKYTREGKVEFIVNSETITDDKVNIIIAVKDTGIGIKEEDIPVLFDSFSRVDEHKNSRIEGTGLGLAITQRLVKMMQGSIKVDSVYGEGTTFTIRIPQKVVDAAPLYDYEAKAGDSKAGNEKYTHIDASDLEILVVDDNKLNLTVAKGLLKPTKAKVDTCLSGAECLEKIVQKHYDFVLLDHMMPKMDGIETLHRAKALEDSKCKDTVFIALTANAISGVKELYMAEGFDDYVSKPIDNKCLEATIEKYRKGAAL
ncbi:MAG: ATP-binding protein [Lachnospiraceae bacterium]|nr:ATP-binding protein [Lachnospiraceae bacterium]